MALSCRDIVEAPDGDDREEAKSGNAYSEASPQQADPWDEESKLFSKALKEVEQRLQDDEEENTKVKTGCEAKRWSWFLRRAPPRDLGIEQKGEPLEPDPIDVPSHSSSAPSTRGRRIWSNNPEGITSGKGRAFGKGWLHDRDESPDVTRLYRFGQKGATKGQNGRKGHELADCDPVLLSRGGYKFVPRSQEGGYKGGDRSCHAKGSQKGHERNWAGSGHKNGSKVNGKGSDRSGEKSGTKGAPKGSGGKRIYSGVVSGSPSLAEEAPKSLDQELADAMSAFPKIVTTSFGANGKRVVIYRLGGALKMVVSLVEDYPTHRAPPITALLVSGPRGERQEALLKRAVRQSQMLYIKDGCCLEGMASWLYTEVLPELHEYARAHGSKPPKMH